MAPARTRGCRSTSTTWAASGWCWRTRTCSRRSPERCRSGFSRELFLPRGPMGNLAAEDAPARACPCRLLLVPAVVPALFVLPLHRGPGHLVRGFLPCCVAASVVGGLVLVPGSFQGFLVAFLRLFGRVVSHRIGEFVEGVVG